MYRILITPPRDAEATNDAASRQPSNVDTESASDRSPTGKVANAELRFGGELDGLTLGGFSVWNNGAEGLRVSFPTRRYSGTGGKRSYLLLRATDPNDRTAYDRLTCEILGAYGTYILEHDNPRLAEARS